MKQIFLVTIISLFSFSMMGQEKAMTHKEKKELKAKENQEKIEALYKLVETREFIVEATQVFGTSGETYTISPEINFFTVDSSSSTIQLSFVGVSGWNGIGGVTIDGNIDRYDLKELKEGKPITLMGSIIERIGGNTQFTMYVYSSGLAQVEISGKRASRITIQGRISTLANSNVYKGIPLN